MKAYRNEFAIIFCETPDGNLPADLTNAKMGFRTVGQWLPQFAIVLAVIDVDGSITKAPEYFGVPEGLDEFIIKTTNDLQGR